MTSETKAMIFVWFVFIHFEQKLYAQVCKSKDICNVVMLSKDTKMLEFGHYHKSDKAPFVIYADLYYQRLMDAKMIQKNHLRQK